MEKKYIIRRKKDRTEYVSGRHESISVVDGKVIICVPYITDDIMSCWESETLYAEEV